MRIQTTFALASITAVLGSFALGGCPGTLDDPSKFLDGGSTGSSGCPDIETEVFQVPFAGDVTGCAGASCHDPMLTQTDLVSPGVKERLLGEAMGTGACNGDVIVADPSDPEGSLLYNKVSSTTPTCGGSQMPLIGTKFDDELLKCLADYIRTLGSGGSGSGGSGTGGEGTGGEGTGGDGTGGDGTGGDGTGGSAGGM